MRLMLRPLEQGDEDRLLIWRNSPEVSRYMYTDHLISADEHRRWFIGALEAADRRYWIIELDHRPVGLASLAELDPHARRGAWAFYLADPATRGRGVGACVEYLMLEHAFVGVGLNKLSCEVLIDNQAVWELHLRFGFHREALFRRHVWKAGCFHDVVGLGLLAEDWAALRFECEARLRERRLLQEASLMVGRPLRSSADTDAA